MVEYITHNGKIFSIIIRSFYRKEDIEFFTAPEYSQQLAYMNRPKGHVILPHKHNIIQREVYYTNEVLFIKNGRVRVDFYDEERNYLKSKILEKGDVILLAHGGHGFEILEDAEIIEVKQGPYVGEMDKTRFNPIDKSKVRIE